MSKSVLKAEGSKKVKHFNCLGLLLASFLASKVRNV